MNKDTIFQFLNKSKKPISAYEILDNLRDKGFKAPISIYRALDILIDEGKVHKINNEKKYVVCNYKHKDDNLIFSVCKKCKVVIEYQSENINKLIAQLCNNNSFKQLGSTITIEGYCAKCTR